MTEPADPFEVDDNDLIEVMHEELEQMHRNQRVLFATIKKLRRDKDAEIFRLASELSKATTVPEQD